MRKFRVDSIEHCAFHIIFNSRPQKPYDSLYFPNVANLSQYSRLLCFFIMRNYAKNWNIFICTAWHRQRWYMVAMWNGNFHNFYTECIHVQEGKNELLFVLIRQKKSTIRTLGRCRLKLRTVFQEEKSSRFKLSVRIDGGRAILDCSIRKIPSFPSRTQLMLPKIVALSVKLIYGYFRSVFYETIKLLL